MSLGIQSDWSWPRAVGDGSWEPEVECCFSSMDAFGAIVAGACPEYVGEWSFWASAGPEAAFLIREATRIYPAPWPLENTPMRNGVAHRKTSRYSESRGTRDAARAKRLLREIVEGK